jgi:FkbM family methyltransferase
MSRRFLREKVKHALLERWGMPHSPVPGVSPCVFRKFRDSGPITLVDIGAHEGSFTTGMNSLCSVKDALLIEPIEALAQKLAHDPALSGYRVIDCAISDFDGEIEMKVFPSAPMISSALSLDRSVDDSVRIESTVPLKVVRPTLRLDTVAAGFAPSAIDLIKIDVQGLEHLVIKGGGNTLSRAKAVFTEVSFRPLYEGSSLFHEIHQMLTALGFAMTALEPGHRGKSGELFQADALFVHRLYL